MAFRADHYTREAKRQGYPARSVFKLKELQNRLSLLKKGDRVADLGAAPGSWSLYSCNIVGSGGLVVGIDRLPFALTDPPKQLLMVQGDLLSNSVMDQLSSYAPFDVVLSDAAPATTGHRLVDCGASYQLSLQVWSIASKILKPGGNLLVKIFQGGDEASLLASMKRAFQKTRTLRPKAVRSCSFEVFLFGENFNGN